MLDLIQSIGSLLTGGGIALLTLVLFFDSRRRTEKANALKAEAEAEARKEDNITSYAVEWKHLYEKKEERVVALEKQAEDDRARIRKLQEENTRLSLELQQANFLKCEVHKCSDRKPPTGY